MSAPNSLNEAMARLDAGLAAWGSNVVAAAAAAPGVVAAAEGPPPPPILGAAPPPTTAASNSHFVNFKRAIIDMFDHWHMGYDAITNYDRTAREEEFKKIPIPPRSGPYRGFQWPPEERRVKVNIFLMDATASSGSVIVNPPRGFRERLRRRRQFGSGDDDENEDGSRGRQPRRRSYMKGMEREQRKVTRNLGRALADGFKPAGWAFKRILGAGGYGVVFLFEMVGQDGERIPVVVKGSLRKGPDGIASMKKEAENIVVSILVGPFYSLSAAVLS